MIGILKWEVVVTKNPDPDEANDDNLSWKVINKIRFSSDDPKDWGEFRAYGGSWTRKLNRTHDERNIYDDLPTAKPNKQLKGSPRREQTTSQLSKNTHLPFWGLSLGPNKETGWRIEEDQHMHIYYAKVVADVPRSDPKSKWRLQDDDNNPDNPKDAKNPKDLQGLGDHWHIIATDEPAMGGDIGIGDFVEYWHRGEFQIRYPKTKISLPQRKQIYLRVTGLYPNWKYIPAIDTTNDDMPAEWESYITSSEKDGFETRYYHSRNKHLKIKG